MVRDPLNYVGNRPATSTKLGPIYLDSDDFSVAEDGKVSFANGDAITQIQTDSGDSNEATPSSGEVSLLGQNGFGVTNSGGTITGQIDEDYLRLATVSLTNSEIKNLTTAQKELVAAPGAGKLLAFEKAILKLNAGSEVLTESDDNMVINYVDDSGASVSQAIEATGFIDQSADTYTSAQPKIDVIVAASSGENKALVLDNSGSGDYAGNASNDATMDVAIWYRVLSL